MTAFEWVVAILAITLAVLLFLSIYFVYNLVKFIKQLRTISDKAEKVASNVEAASTFFKNSAGPMAVSKFITNIVDAVRSDGDKRNK